MNEPNCSFTGRPQGGQTTNRGEELVKRLLEDVPTTKLLALAASLRGEAAKRGGTPQLSAVIPDGDLRNEMVPGMEVSWEA